MSKFIVFALVLVAACLILVNAAPAPEQILDAQTAINKIIGNCNNSCCKLIKLCSHCCYLFLLQLPTIAFLAARLFIPGRWPPSSIPTPLLPTTRWHSFPLLTTQCCVICFSLLIYGKNKRKVYPIKELKPVAYVILCWEWECKWGSLSVF